MERISRAVASALVVVVSSSAAASAQVALAGYVFDDLAAPDLAVPVAGAQAQFSAATTGCVGASTLPGLSASESLSAVFTGMDLTTWTLGETRVRLDFVDNEIVNAPGPDLVVFELGGPEGFEVSIFVETLGTWSAARAYTPSPTGFSQDPCGTGAHAINAAAIDLSDFGVLAGASVRRVQLANGGVFGTATGGDVALVLALHSAAPSAPLAASLLSFQQGVDAGAGTYVGAADTCLASDLPSTVHGAFPLEYTDGSPVQQLLLRFDGIVGTGPGQLRPGSQVQRALVHLSIGPELGGSNGSSSIHRVLQPWNAAAATWANAFGGDGVQANGIEATAAAVGTIPATGSDVTRAIDVTAAVQAWADGAPNHGLLVTTTSSDGLGVHMAEAAPETLRPALTVHVAGILAYAGAVADFDPIVIGGDPFACNLDASLALGAPDTIPGTPFACCNPLAAAVTLGVGGSLTLEFTTVSISGDGSPEPDLWIFETGPDVEDTYVELSADLVAWQPLGKVFGSTSSIDLDALGIGPFDLFRYVRLTDDPLEGDLDGCTVGADIDAVAALAPNPWVALGAPLAGTFGAPVLSAAGALASGQQVAFQIANALPGAPAFVVVGASPLFLPLLGGTLVPALDVLLGPVAIGPFGGLTLPVVAPLGLPAGLSIFVQAWILDPAAPAGVAATNAIVSVTQ